MNKGYIYAAISAILFGSAGILIKLAFSIGSNSISLLILQYTIAVIIMFFLILIKNYKDLYISRKVLFRTAVLGVVGNTFMTVFYYKAFNYLQVSLVTILLYTYPIMVFVHTLIFKKHNINKNKILALIIAFAGCFLALGLNKGDFTVSVIGIIFGLLAALFYSFMSLYAEVKLSDTSALAVNFYSTIFSLISLVLFRMQFGKIYENLSLELLAYTTLLAVFCEIVPLTLLYSAIKKIGSLKVSIIGNLEIPTAMVLSYMLLNESLLITQVIGALMVVYAIYKIKK